MESVSLEALRTFTPWTPALVDGSDMVSGQDGEDDREDLEEGVEVMENTEVVGPPPDSPVSQFCIQMAAFSYDKAKEIAVMMASHSWNCTGVVGSISFF